MQAIPVRWEFAEGVPISSSSGGFEVVSENTYSTLTGIGSNWRIGTQSSYDAANPGLPAASASIWFSDPPYYDAVPYADLSDFFYVWLKRMFPQIDVGPLTPKANEIVQDGTKEFEGRPKDRQFFEARMGLAFSAGRMVLADNGVGCVVFAHKTTEGWEALLSGMTKGAG